MVGTGDLSELALGWATYNGDHMSMYGVNAGVPKTLVRHLVQYEADIAAGRSARGPCCWTFWTRRSPQSCSPPRTTARSRQKTEDLVGPYELHDFFLYHVLRFGFWPGQDLPAGAGRLCRPCRVRRTAVLVQVAAQLLLAVLCPAVQAQLPAGRPQGGQRDPLASRRLADAQRRGSCPLAGRTGAESRSTTTLDNRS